MPRPTELDLTDLDAQAWRSVPMPGSNGGIELVPLAAPEGHFSILGRFPAGFERLTPGGYHASEEVLVLDGELLLEGGTYRRGDLVVVPAEYLRTDMRSPQGCVVLAWFAGPADFLAAEDLEACTDVITSVQVDGASGALVGSGVAEWSVGEALVAGGGSPTLEVVAADLSRWARGQAAVPSDDALVRRGP
ncbi:cupin domain-containing protein [Aeromicrobium alkaliterrae]|uniref:ChrR-like cupin domain-containing protein n=1 Tax=Aeromicrobium alkaliterrae TaxID=302168 RepID=A0ABN2K171_9ACTN